MIWMKENNMDDEYDKIEITSLEDIPDSIREFVDADVEVLMDMCIPEECHSKPEWKALITVVALHKHQLEVANTRLEELHDSMGALARTVLSFGSDFKKLCSELNKWQQQQNDDKNNDDDWWKRS